MLILNSKVFKSVFAPNGKHTMSFFVTVRRFIVSNISWIHKESFKIISWLIQGVEHLEEKKVCLLLLNHKIILTTLFY